MVSSSSCPQATRPPLDGRSRLLTQRFSNGTVTHNACLQGVLQPQPTLHTVKSVYLHGMGTIIIKVHPSGLPRGQAGPASHSKHDSYHRADSPTAW